MIVWAYDFYFKTRSAFFGQKSELFQKCEVNDATIMTFFIHKFNTCVPNSNFGSKYCSNQKIIIKPNPLDMCGGGSWHPSSFETTFTPQNVLNLLWVGNFATPAGVAFGGG